MTYRIFARAPYEGTHPYDPTSITTLWRSGILNPLYALKLAQIEGNKEAYYDVDFEVVDRFGHVVRREDFLFNAHVDARIRHLNDLNDQFIPW